MLYIQQFNVVWRVSSPGILRRDGLQKGGKGLTKPVCYQQELRPLCYSGTKRPQVSQAPWNANLPPPQVLALEELLEGLQGRECSTCWDTVHLPPPSLPPGSLPKHPQPLLPPENSQCWGYGRYPSAALWQRAGCSASREDWCSSKPATWCWHFLATAFSTAPLGRNL